MKTLVGAFLLRYLNAAASKGSAVSAGRSFPFVHCEVSMDRPCWESESSLIEPISFELSVGDAFLKAIVRGYDSCARGYTQHETGEDLASPTTTQRCSACQSVHQTPKLGTDAAFFIKISN
jgi:hypothetical protein